MLAYSSSASAQQFNELDTKVGRSCPIPMTTTLVAVSFSVVEVQVISISILRSDRDDKGAVTPLKNLVGRVDRNADV